MKGVWSVLERAGLVREEGSEVPNDITFETAAGPAPLPEPEPVQAAPMEDVAGLSLEQVYQAAGVPAAPYPAERLLRLIDGLKAMDEGTRRQAIRAMDAADDSWTIEDPIRDAAAKVAALESHAANVRASLARTESDTQTEIARLAQQHESSVAEIMRQMKELEALLSREVARAAQERAGLESGLKSKIESTSRELGNLSRHAGDLRSLVSQFQPNPSN
jgi:hypothetical protein